MIRPTLFQAQLAGRKEVFVVIIFALVFISFVCSYLKCKRKIQQLSAVFDNYFVLHSKYVHILPYEKGIGSYENFINVYREQEEEVQKKFAAQFLFASKLDDIAKRSDFILVAKMNPTKSDFLQEANRASDECWKKDCEFFMTDFQAEAVKLLTAENSTKNAFLLIHRLCLAVPDSEQQKLNSFLQKQWKEIENSISEQEINEKRKCITDALALSANLDDFKKTVAKILQTTSAKSLNTVKAFANSQEVLLEEK